MDKMDKHNRQDPPPAGDSGDAGKRPEGPEERLRQMSQAVEQSPAAVIVTDVQGNITYVNPKFTEMTGYSFEEVKGKNPRLLQSGDTPTEVYRGLWATITSGHTWRGEWQNKRKDGRLYREQASVSPILDAQGRITHYVAVKEDITDRWRVEQALRESRERFRGLVEATSDWIWEVDAQGAYTYVSPHVKELLGYEPHELLGKTPFDLMPPDEARRLRGLFQTVIADRRPFASLENINIHKDGRHVVLETSGVPILDAQGNLAGYRGIDRDVTERKRAEEAVRKSEQRLRGIFENAGVGILEADAEDRFTAANDHACQVLGYARHDLLGKSVHDLTAPEDRPRSDEFNAQLHEGRFGRFDTDKRYLRSDGTPLWVHVTVSTVRDLAGRHIGAVATIEDISARKRAEEELQKSRAMLRYVLDTVPQSVFWKDRNSVYMGCNQVFANAVGLKSPDEIVGKSDFDLPWPRAEAEAYRADDKHVILSGAPKMHIHERLQRADGTRIWIDTSKSPLLDEHGNVYGVLGVYEDITERKRAEEALLENERKARAVFNSSFGFTGLLSPDGAVLDANQTALEFAGVQLSDVAGKLFWETPWWSHSAEMQDRLRAAVRAAAGGQVVRFEATHPALDGTIHTVDVSIKPLQDDQGRVTLLIPEGRDITERKRAEEALQLRVGELAALNAMGRAVNATLAMKQTTTAAMQGMLNAVRPDLAFLFLRDGDRLVLTEALPPSARQRVGEIPEHRVGDCLCGLAVREGRPLYSRNICGDFRCTWQECKRAGMVSFAALPLRSENQIVGVIGLASATDRDFEKQAGFLETLAGQVSVALANARLYELVQRELADRKRVEEDLRQSRQMLQTVLDAIPVRVFWKDRDLIYRGCNRAFVRDTGLRGPEELIGKDDYRMAWREQADLYRGDDRQVIDSGVPKIDYEEPQTAPDGRRRWLRTSKIPLIGADGTIHGILGVYEDVTERKRAEESLRESEARYRGLVELSPDAIFVNRNNRIELVNPAALQLFGATSAEQILGKAPLGMFHPDSQQIVRRRIRTVLAGQSVPLIEEKIIRLDGTVRIAEVAASPFVDREGIAIQVFLRDITDRKRAEDALRVSEEQLRQAARVAGLGIFDHDQITEKILWSREMRETCGWGPATEAGLAEWVNLVHPEDRTTIARAIGVAHDPAGDGRYSVEHRILRPDGSQRWVSVQSQTFFEGEGSSRCPVRTIGAMLDITDRKQTEEALRLSADRVQTLLTLNQMTDASVKETADFALEAAIRLTSSTLGYVAFVNKQEDVLTMQSWSREAMAECQIAVKPLAYPLETTGLWGEAVRQRRPIITNDYEAENPLKRGYPQGHVKLKRHMNVPVFFGGKIVLVAGVGNKEQEYNGTDVQQLTLLMDGLWRLIDRKLAQEELKHTADDLRRSNQDLEQFAYVASHDLQEPLRMVTGYMDLLETRYKGKLDKDAGEFIAFAVDGARRMQQLIKDLLAYSRVGTRGQEPKPVSVQAAFDRAVADLWGIVRDTGAEITHDPLPVVWADETQLTQVLLNFFSNAIKFRGDHPPRIHLGARHELDEWVFSVRDNGIGIEPRNFDRIFQVFQRLHTREKYPGSGIGLAICKKIVERHGGRIWVESQPHLGSTFHFTIPDKGDAS